jgi:hypothetical protein
LRTMRFRTLSCASASSEYPIPVVYSGIENHGLGKGNGHAQRHSGELFRVRPVYGPSDFSSKSGKGIGKQAIEKIVSC